MYGYEIRQVMWQFIINLQQSQLLKIYMFHVYLQGSTCPLSHTRVIHVSQYATSQL